MLPIVGLFLLQSMTAVVDAAAKAQRIGCQELCKQELQNDKALCIKTNQCNNKKKPPKLSNGKTCKDKCASTSKVVSVPGSSTTKARVVKTTDRKCMKQCKQEVKLACRADCAQVARNKEATCTKQCIDQRKK